MTLMTERPRRALELRRDQLVLENKEHLNTGAWDEYVRNCKRIKKLTEELNRRDGLKNTLWKEYAR